MVDSSTHGTIGSDLHCYDTRNKMLVRLPLCKTNWGQQTSQFMFFKEWNELPSCIKDSNSFRDFKKSYLNNMSPPC